MVQDGGDLPVNDAETYKQVLAGLKLAARHVAAPLLDSLLTWRKEALAQAQAVKPRPPGGPNEAREAIALVLRKKARLCLPL